MSQYSRFAHARGVLFAADVPSRNDLYNIIDSIISHIDAIKIGNSVLYPLGISIVADVKARYGLPVFADLKLTDVGHIAAQVCRAFALAGADAVVVSGIAGGEVLSQCVTAVGADCEIWAFTEFTHASGLIDEKLGDEIVKVAQAAGALGFQAPGTRPWRVEDVRDEVGDHFGIMSCGIGAQGARFGSAISRGANFEIIGRAIYDAPSPRRAAEEAHAAIHSVCPEK